MDNLIAELERATEGSRELDKSIYMTLGLPITNKDRLSPQMIEIHLESVAPHFSTSLDAALLLVPEGWVWHVQIDYELPGRADLYNAVPGGKYDPPVHVQADGATPALALCIVSLRACQAMKEDG